MSSRPGLDFDCLWCGRAYRVGSAQDLEGWARLCPECLAGAGQNPFLRFRLRRALLERARSAETRTTGGEGRHEDRSTPHDQPTPDAQMIAYYEARAAEYDDWYLRRGPYSHGPVHDMAWQAELDQVTAWLDGLPLGGVIVELASGTGWWSALLATKGELWLSDLAAAPLERARARLAAHKLTAQVRLRDAWADPDRLADALFCGFWLSHIPREQLGRFMTVARRWVRPGGVFAFVDSRLEPRSGTTNPLPAPGGDRARRRLADGREFVIPKIYYQPAELERALLDAGFRTAEVGTTPRFFLLGRASS